MDVIDYAKKLASSGFKVWHVPGIRDGFLIYQNTENGFWGTFQQSEFEGWQHLMPIKPSREIGSSMFMEEPGDPWTVQAAQQCAQEFNTNKVVGRQRNNTSYSLPAKAVEVTAA